MWVCRKLEMDKGACRKDTFMNVVSINKGAGKQVKEVRLESEQVQMVSRESC